MSAPAPALAAPAKTPRKIAVVRMADVSGAVAVLSLIFGLLLVISPELFPRMIVRSWPRFSSGMRTFLNLFKMSPRSFGSGLRYRK